MKKLIAILMTAAMILPMTAYGATVDTGESQDKDASDAAEEDSIEEALDDILSALDELRDEWDSALAESEDAEEEEEKSEEYQAYDEIIAGILEDIEDTVAMLVEDFDAAFDEVADEEDLSDEELEEYVSDWFEELSGELDDLIDRTNASSRDFLRMVVPDTDGDDAALEDALHYYYDEIVDGTLEILCEQILGNVLDAAVDGLTEILEDWDPDEWDLDDWDIDDWDLGDWDVDDWDIGDWDIEEWNGLSDFLDQFGESFGEDWNPYNNWGTMFNL